MRETVSLFLIAELLDYITTIVGIGIGIPEQNLLYGNLLTLFIVKALCTIGVAIVLQVKSYTKYDMLIPALAFIAAPWNFINIIAYIT